MLKHLKLYFCLRSMDFLDWLRWPPLHCQPLTRHVIPWLRISSGLLRVCNTSKKQPKICSLHLSIDWFSCHVCRMRSYVQ